MAVEQEPNAFLPGAELQRPGDGKTAPDPSRRADRFSGAARNGAHGIEGRVPLAGEIASVLRRYRPRLDVGLVGELHHRSRGPGAGHPAALMGAVDPREADVVVHHELPGLGGIVGPGAMKLTVVVAVPGDAGLVDDRPVGHVPKEPVGVIFEISRLDARRRQPQAIGVRRSPVPLLYRIAAAERCPAAAVHQLAADIEVLVDDEHRRAEVSGPDSGMQPHASRPEDDDIRLIIPDDAAGAGRGLLGERLPARQNRRPYAGGRSAREEISPAKSFPVLELWFLPAGAALLGHMFLPEICYRQALSLVGDQGLPLR